MSSGTFGSISIRLFVDCVVFLDFKEVRERPKCFRRIEWSNLKESESVKYSKSVHSGSKMWCLLSR